MSEEVSEELEIPEELVETPPEPEPIELPDQIYKYQPTDEEGRPMGGEQIIKYKTLEELPNKLQEQNILLIRKLREVTRKNRLGIVEQETIPEEVKRFPKTINLTPKELTAEERVKLSRDILDPERFEEAQDEIFQSRFGAKPAEFRESYQDMQERLSIIQGQQEVANFMQANPGYYACDHNRNTIVNWLAKNNLALVRDNFQLAYDTLREFMVSPAPTTTLPVKLPITEVQSEPVNDLPVDINAPDPIVPPPAPRRVATGLTKNQASDAAPAKVLGDDIVYEVIDPYSKVKRTYKGLAAVEAMSAEEFKKRVNSDPTFSERIERLEKQAEAARKGR